MSPDPEQPVFPVLATRDYVVDDGVLFLNVGHRNITRGQYDTVTRRIARGMLGFPIPGEHADKGSGYDLEGTLYDLHSGNLVLVGDIKSRDSDARKKAVRVYGPGQGDIDQTEHLLFDRQD